MELSLANGALINSDTPREARLLWDLGKYVPEVNYVTMELVLRAIPRSEDSLSFILEARVEHDGFTAKNRRSLAIGHLTPSRKVPVTVDFYEMGITTKATLLDSMLTQLCVSLLTQECIARANLDHKSLYLEAGTRHIGYCVDTRRLGSDRDLLAALAQI